MNTEIIKQIQKIAGIKTVEIAGKDMAVVVFDGEERKPLFITEDGVEIFEGDPFYVVIKAELILLSWSYPAESIEFKASKKSKALYGEALFSTKEAAQAYVQKQKPDQPKSLRPEELVDGEIYYSREDNNSWLFRFSCMITDDRVSANYAKSYSMIDHWGGFSIGGNLVFSDRIRTCRPATLLEKQQLIAEEVKHNYFHELKNIK